jgi:hypothetical protein
MFDPRIYTETLISTCELRLQLWKGVYETLEIDFECRTPSQQELHIYEAILLKRMKDEFEADTKLNILKNIASGYQHRHGTKKPKI